MKAPKITQPATINALIPKAASHYSPRPFHAPQDYQLEEQNENRTGLPDRLKAGVENLSGLSLDDVKVHFNSSKPSELDALAYTQGTNIHVGPDQERHLPHEAWHVVQQKQGRVVGTRQLKGLALSDSATLEHEADVMGAKALHQKHDDMQKYKKAKPGKSLIQRMTRRKGSALTPAERAQAIDIGEQNYRSKSGHGRAEHGKRASSTPQKIKDQQAARSRQKAIDEVIQLKSGETTKPASMNSLTPQMKGGVYVDDNDLLNRSSAVSSPKPKVGVQEIPFSGEKARDRNVSEKARQLLAKNSAVMVPASAWAQGILGNDYGITLPERPLGVVIGAQKSGDHWNPYIKDLNGTYSRQAHILGHQADIPNAAAAAQGTYQAIIASLNALGVPGNLHNYYSLAAVEAHESKHAHKLLPALQETEALIKVRLAEYDDRVAIAGAPNEIAAVNQIQALPNYDTRVVGYGWKQWLTILLQKVADDHNGNGPCELAEKSITVPLAKAIQERAVQQGWVPTPPQVAGGAQPGGVAAIAGQLQAPAPAPVSGEKRPEPKRMKNIKWPPD